MGLCCSSIKEAEKGSLTGGVLTDCAREELLPVKKMSWCQSTTSMTMSLTWSCWGGSKESCWRNEDKSQIISNFYSKDICIDFEDWLWSGCHLDYLELNKDITLPEPKQRYPPIPDSVDDLDFTGEWAVTQTRMRHSSMGVEMVCSCLPLSKISTYTLSAICSHVMAYSQYTHVSFTSFSPSIALSKASCSQWCTFCYQTKEGRLTTMHSFYWRKLAKTMASHWCLHMCYELALVSTYNNSSRQNKCRRKRIIEPSSIDKTKLDEPGTHP